MKANEISIIDGLEKNIYISPEQRQEVIDDLRLKEENY